MCFAISNVVTFNDLILCTIPLPELIAGICGIFRASSRMFYPVYYTIFCLLIILLWKILDDNKNYAYAILTFIVILQLFDIHNMQPYYWIANSGNYDKTDALSQKILADCKVNGDLGKNIIVTTSSETADYYRQFDVGIYEIEGSYFICKEEKRIG